MGIVLGIGGSFHDISVCIIADGQILVAIEEERLSRIKHHPLDMLSISGLRLRGIQYCLEEGHLELGDIDVIATNDLLFQGFLRGLKDVVLYNHHLTHAAAAFYTSPYNESAILVADGFGSILGAEAEVTSHFHGIGTDLRRIKTLYGSIQIKPGSERFTWSAFDYVTESIGMFYSQVTELIGFGRYQEGSTTGLAAFGSSRYLDAFMSIVAPHSAPFGFRYDVDAREHIAQLVISELLSARGESDAFEKRAAFAAAAQRVLEHTVLSTPRLSGQQQTPIVSALLAGCS